MTLRKRIAQLVAVIGLAVVGMMATSDDAAGRNRTHEYCWNGCDLMGVCNPQGGTCTPEPCLGVDGVWYTHKYTCNEPE